MSGGRLHLPLLLAAAAVVLALAHSAQIRDRAEAALGRGMPPREAALARGFVLGEDEEVDPATTEDFRRAGLSHLLAVSGQNVALLALLAMPLLAVLGMPLRTRLLWVLGLIAVYVPLAGAGPSIQRAGIMGGLSVLATLSGRRASRLYGLAFAAVVLLALEPGIAADVGWQLSFAAVLGILLLATPLRRAILARIGKHGWRRALADGAAMTIAATLATAPLIVFHFEELSTTTLAANLLALPAVAPAMWLGMLAAAAGQVPGLPVEALNALDAPLLAYIAQVAAWCGRPSWASLHVQLGLGGLAASYVLLAGAAIGVQRIARHRQLRRLRRIPGPMGRFPTIYVGFRPVGGEFLRWLRVWLRWGWRLRHLSPGATPRDRRLACASPCSTSARATRSCCSRGARRPCWSTAGRRATGSPPSCATRGSSGSAPRSSPTTRRTMRAVSATC